MCRGAPLAALVILALAVAVLPNSSAIRVDNDAPGDFDDHDLPHEDHHKGGDEDEEKEEDDEVDLDFGPGRHIKRMKVSRGEDADWDLEKMLRTDEAFHWDDGLTDDNYEDILSKYSSEAPDDLDDWD